MRAAVSLAGVSWRLAKVPLCGLIGCSTVFGGALAVDATLSSLVGTACGVMLVAMAGATGNSLQERHIDGRLPRTAARPLVQGEASIGYAILQLCILTASGLLLQAIYSQEPLLSSFLTLLALALYNGVYTTLKQRTLLALPVGAICGGLPPVIGWIGSGGLLLSYTSLLLFSLLILWQIPHFGLILLMYRHDYLVLNQPTLLKKFQEEGVRRISAVWAGGLGLVMILFAGCSGVSSGWQSVAIIVNSVVATAFLWQQLLMVVSPDYRRLFICLNSMLGNHMAIIILFSAGH